MKLLARYNRVNVAATIIVLLVSSLCYYFIIRSVLLNQLDNDLKVEEQEIIDYVKMNKSLPDPSDYKDQKVELQDVIAKPVLFVSTTAKRTLDDVSDATEKAMALLQAAIKKDKLTVVGPAHHRHHELGR